MDAALEVVRRALETVAEPGVGFFVSELHRVQGLCLLRRGSVAERTRSLRTAVDVARAQRATVLEVRAAISLARAAIAHHRPSEGVNALSELCASLPRRSTRRSCARRASCFRRHASLGSGR